MTEADLDVWREFVSRHGGGGMLDGVVLELAPFGGVFVALADDVQGFLHESEFAEPPAAGTRVRVRIRAADFELRRMSLTLM